MPRRALAQKRPFLLLSLAAALAFYYLRASELPEFYVIPIKGAAIALLAIYCRVRHSSDDAHLLALALGAAALGDMALEIDIKIAALLFFLAHVLALGVFLRNKRGQLTGAQSWLVGLTLTLPPLIAYFFPTDRELAWQAALYALALGGMAAGAWASGFPHYRVGAGAMLVLVAHLLIIGALGPLARGFAAEYLVWPVYYLGQFLLCTGVIQTLRKRDPELKVVE